MGEVFLADDAKLGRKVALKVLAHALAADPERRGRFDREARAVAALNHPNIVTIYSVEDQDGVLFLTMELVEGKTLTELIPLAGHVARTVAARRHSAGRRGRRGAPAGHHASRPEARERDGQRRGPREGARLRPCEAAEESPADGLPPATTGALTAEGRIVGTVAYMSPEQAQGKPSMRARTSFPWASCCSRWPRARGRSRATPTYRCCPPS